METSATIKELAAALSKFQATVPNVTKDGLNPYFKSKYATLENTISTVRDLLAKNGLSFSQFPTGENELATILMHNSGEYIKATAKMTPKDSSPQAQGSAITYLRRYALSAVLGIATEDDDDGNSASTTKREPMKSYDVPRKEVATDDEPLSKQFLAREEIAAVQKDKIKEMLVQLGRKATKSAVKELTGLDFLEDNYSAIIAKLFAMTEETDPLASALNSKE